MHDEISSQLMILIIFSSNPLYFYILRCNCDLICLYLKGCLHKYSINVGQVNI